jgi:hypothetical protein
MEVVLGQVDRSLCFAEERRNRMGDIERLLAAVRQRSNLEGLGGQRKLIPANPTLQSPKW